MDKQKHVWIVLFVAMAKLALGAGGSVAEQPHDKIDTTTRCPDAAEQACFRAGPVQLDGESEDDADDETDEEGSEEEGGQEREAT